MNRAQRKSVGDVHLYGGSYIREMLTPDEGTALEQHSHRYDHLSYLAAGSVRVWADGVLVGAFLAPAAIKIPAHVQHRFLTLAPWTMLLCIHAVADAENHHDDDLIEAEG